jgi:preprotein translocase YajC subunit
MMKLMTILADAAPAAAAGGEGGAQQVSPLAGMAPMLLIITLFVVFMIFMSRSRKRQEAEHQKMVLGLEPGTRVMLNSGLIARIDRIDVENREVRVVVDEEKRVHATYSSAAVAKVFDEKKTSVKDSVKKD